MSEERKCYNCEGRKVVPEGEGGPYVTVCPQCGGTDKSDTIQSLTAQLAEARELLGEMANPKRPQDHEYVRSMAAKAVTLSLPSSSALARYGALEEVANETSGIFHEHCGKCSLKCDECRFRGIKQALAKLQEVPHGQPD
jgi:hypothetical protein